VEAGDFLRFLEAHNALGRCQAGEIHRQIPADYRAAVRTSRYTEQPMHWNVSQLGRFFPPLTARKKHCFFGKLRERGGRVFAAGRISP
jgi:hypothetical protein